MNPTACLNLILTSFADGDIKDAQTGMDELCVWLRSGGLPPRVALYTEDTACAEMDIFVVCHGTHHLMKAE
jgi:hypothetical protein